MAHDSKWSVHDNIWHFTVTEPQLHKNGFTVYKVNCKTFPIKAPETLTELICWKRYNDFKTLYKSLSALHKALHRKDMFPDFAKPKLFGRFDDDVIEERRQSAAALLNFVSTQPHLYKSLVFKQFLEDGKSPTSPNPKGLDILVAAGGSHPRSDGYPPPDLVPAAAESTSGTNEGRVFTEDPSSRSTFQGSLNGESQAVLKPSSVNHERDKSSTEPLTADDPNHSRSNKPTDLPVLQGTWNYPAAADNISLNSSNGKDTTDTDDEVNDIGEDDDDDVEEDSAVATSLPDTDLAFFDPMTHDAVGAQPAEELSAGITRSNSWLLEGLNMCAEMETNESKTGKEDEDFCNSGEQTMMSVGSTVTNGSEQPVSASDKTSSCELSSEFELIKTMSQSSDGSKVEYGKGDLDLSSEWQARSASFTGSTQAAAFGGSKGQQIHSGDQAVEYGKQNVLSTSGSHNVNLENSQNSPERKSSARGSNSNKSTPSRGSKSNLLRRLVSGVSSNKGASQPAATTVKPRSATEQSVSSMDLGGKEDYIYLAASQICMAQNSEVNGDFEVAFAYYKSGVGILLQGVQGDTNKARRDAVRRKTAQYLMKAEDLFNRHLATEKVDERRWGADSFLSPSLDLDPSFAFIRGSTRELRNFQVLGTIDNVVLVRDKSTDETFVVKSIPKSTPDTERTQSILPTSCPHMVSLHRFFETDNCVFLLLQYASGGKLWTYIGDYLQTDRGNAGIEFSVNKCNLQAKNIYSGTKVESDTLSTEYATVLDNKITGDNDVTVQSSKGLGAVRLSDLQRRKHSDDVNSDELSSSSPHQTESADDCNKNHHNSNHSDTDINPPTDIMEPERRASLKEAEGLDQFSDSALKSVPKSVTKNPLNRRLSNLSDDVYVASATEEASLTPTPGFEEIEEEEHFQKLLGETHHNIEDFSINSFDSGDVPVRLNSTSSSCLDRIPSIPEDPDNSQSKIDCIPETECLGRISKDTEEDVVFTGERDSGNDFIHGSMRESSENKILVARQISADQVFPHSYFSKETEELIRDAKKRHASVDEGSCVKSHHSVKMYAPTFNADDLIRSSKDLLQHVESVLSKTDTERTVPLSTSPATIEVSNVLVLSESRSQQSKINSESRSVTKQPSNSSHESSAEEPSIYDLNRSSDDDPDECSEAGQGEKLDFPPVKIAESTCALSTEILVDSSSNIPNSNLVSNAVASKPKPVLKNLDIEKPSGFLHNSKVGSTSNSRLSLSRRDSKELTRSASFECDLKSPTRNRARTVAAVFERLDSTSADHIRIPESSIRKWTAQMITAVARLHSLGIVCRDLKPSNILLGDKGQVMLTYFCHLGYGDQELDWDAVDNIYAAPEVSSIGGYDKACDWWSIGALLFELVVGKTLSECHPGSITSHTCLYIPAFVSDEARSLLEGLLKHNSKERLGAGMAGAEEIKAHPFFVGVDWHELEYS